MSGLRDFIQLWVSCGVVLAAIALAATPVAAQPASGPPYGIGPLRLLPPPSITRHTIALPGRSLDYTAEAGTLPLRDSRGEPTAEIFFVGYTLEPRAPERPVTFVFNGGPGASSAFLHLGGIGPRAVAFAENGDILPPPARLIDNPDTWLDMTDLVFVDPPGTGYSRTPDPEQAAQFWGVRQDADAMSAFIRLYLARTNRSGSPVFLVGESYGGFRAAVLSRVLQSDSGIAPLGAVLVSPALEFALLRGEEYQPLTWMLTLPSLAAVNFEAKGVRGGEALAKALGPVEAFVLTDYVVDLANGLQAETRTIERVADFTGLPLDRVRQHDGRIPTSMFIKEFAKTQGRVLSRYDGSMVGPDPEPDEPYPSAPDAVLERAVPAWTTAFVTYVRQELKYATEITFRLLGGEISGRWDYGTTPQRQGFAGSLEDLQEARAVNPSMQVLIVHGYTDLVTPYFASKYLVGQLAPLAGAAPIDVRVYEGGHMMYTRPDARRALKQDARAMYERALSTKGDRT